MMKKCIGLRSISKATRKLVLGTFFAWEAKLCLCTLFLGLTMVYHHVRDSCGVHLLSWLQSWDASEHDEGYTMPRYSSADMRSIKVECLWWLIAHHNNKNRQIALSIVEDKMSKKN